MEIINLVNLLEAAGTAAAILLDCGSTVDITNKRENLVNYVPTFSRKLRLADKSIRDEVGKGDMHVWSRLPAGSKRHLIQVLFVPYFETNLISLKELTKKGRVLVHYGHNDCVLTRDGRIFMSGVVRGSKLWELQLEVIPPEQLSASDRALTVVRVQLQPPGYDQHERAPWRCFRLICAGRCPY